MSGRPDESDRVAADDDRGSGLPIAPTGETHESNARGKPSEEAKEYEPSPGDILRL